MPMSTGKKRRRAHREGIRNLGLGLDRFDDLMAAIGVGTASCSNCTLVRVRSEQEHDEDV